MMQTQWGRKETVIFPPHSPLYSYGAIFLSVMLTGLFLYLHFAVAMSPLQRFYLPYYVRTAVAGAVHRTDKYQMLMVADGAKRSRAARDSDVIAGVDNTDWREAYSAAVVRFRPSVRSAVSVPRAEERNTSIGLFTTTFKARCTAVRASSQSLGCRYYLAWPRYSFNCLFRFEKISKDIRK